MKPDSPTGYDRAPDRYSTQGRETIDRIRDELGDEFFVAFCLGSARKYLDRLGLKGSPEEDRAKARWYLQMALHVGGYADDPRQGRFAFVSYERLPGSREPGSGWNWAELAQAAKELG
jgi:hypothetical protein